MDLAQYLTGGAAGRPDSLSGMQPAFQSALAEMFAAAPPGALAIKSGYRSPELQQQLWTQALAKYGSPEAARKWVAPPGHSEHGMGNAADLSFLTPDAVNWAHEHAPAYGLGFPLSNENWHVELAGARGNGGQAPITAPPVQTVDPRMQQAMAMMTGGGAPTGPVGAGANAGGSTMGNLAALFLQGQQEKQKQRQQEQADEEARRAALFGGGVAGLYG